MSMEKGAIHKYVMTNGVAKSEGSISMNSSEGYLLPECWHEVVVGHWDDHLKEEGD